MGGTIEVESVLNKGTTFRFQIQFTTVQSASPENRDNTLAKKRVLVVDDDHTALEMIQNIIKSFDMRIDTVDSGIKALTALTQAVKLDDPYHFLLIDWKMPHMDGIETVQRIREIQEFANLPKILMISAYDRNECIRQARSLGLSRFVVKPVSHSALHAALFDTLVAENVGQSSKEEPVNKQTDVKTDVKTDVHDVVQGASVLLVEYNKDNQVVAVELLKMFGTYPTVVDNGQKAVDIVREQDFDMILMDIQMPVMDGLTATREIRRLDKPGIDNLPIIALTAHAMEVDYQRSLDAGMDDHLTKPIDPMKLKRMLKSWIVRKE